MVENEGIVVVSLFDGMSCGHMALEKTHGIKVKQYYASEVDKYAIKATMANFPETIQLGDVRYVDVSQLPSKIDLVIGGSPCTDFSFAGKRKGMSGVDKVVEKIKEAVDPRDTVKTEPELETIEILTLEHYLELKKQEFQFEGQSYLFWEYMRILTAVREKNPDVYFLLENVLMGEKWQRVLTRAIGIHPICINSALVSAQNRERLFWTNIGAEPDGLFGDMYCKIPQPKDKGILLKDILEENVPDKYYLKDSAIAGLNPDRADMDKLTNIPDKSYCIDSRYNKGLAKDYFEFRKRQLIVAMRGRKNDEGKYIQQLEFREDDKTNTLTSVEKDNLVLTNKSKDGLICHNIQTLVSVRKHEVDIPGLQKCLKEHKNQSIKEIANKLNVPKTEVEHWFRTDKYFNIPNPELWESIKSLLGIETTEFDAQITEFIEKPSEFDMSNRAYDEDGKNPTLTAAQEGNLIFTKNYVQWDANGLGNKSQDQRAFYEDGKCGTLGSDGSHSQPKVLVENKENTPVQLGNIYNEESNPQAGRVYDTEGKSVTLKSEGGGGGAKTGLYLVGNIEGAYESNGRVYSSEGKSKTLNAGNGGGGEAGQRTGIYLHENSIRRLTPVECERLQTVPDNYTLLGRDIYYQMFTFVGNECNIWPLHYAEKKNVTSQFHQEKLDYVINTILGLLDTEQQKLQDNLLINPKSVKMKIVKDINKQMSVCVCFTIKDGKDTDAHSFLKKLNGEKLEKTAVSGCVQSIIKCSENTEIRCSWKKNDLFQTKETGITENLLGLCFIEGLQKKSSEENSDKEKLSITLTWINLIMIQAISKCLPNQDTRKLISNLTMLPDNSFELKLSYIETESMKSISDTSRYKMLGNGWTVDVIAHIFSYLPLATKK